MRYRNTAGRQTWVFGDLRELMAKASPLRSGDMLAGLAAGSAEENVAAKMCLADVPLATFLTEALVPYEIDEVTRLIIDGHDAAAFAPVAHMTVGEFRDYLLSDAANTSVLTALAPGIIPEMAAAVSKLMRNQDLILVAKKCSVVTRFRNTIGLPGTMAVRLQPNHPTDDRAGVAASVVDGLMYGCGDAVIGINPASNSVETMADLARLFDEIITRFEIPTQACVLTHVTTSIELINRGVPVDLVFQSIAGTEAANTSFGIDLALLAEGRDAARALRRGTIGDNVMYFETGQGSELSANAHHGVDQQTLEARAYAVARAYQPLLGQHGRRLHWPGISLRRQADHPRRARGPFLRQAARPADRLRRLLYQPCPGRPGRHGHPPDPARRRRGHLHHRRARRRRRDAELPVDLVPRPALHPRGAGPAPRPRVRGLAQAHRRHRPRRPAAIADAAPVPAVRAEGAGRMTDAKRTSDVPEGWRRLAELTPARIALGRSGSGLLTREVLKFAMAHAQARDAVHTPFDAPGLAARVAALGLTTVQVSSAAPAREVYLRRPDLGRRLDEASAQALDACGEGRRSRHRDRRRSLLHRR